MTFDDVARVLQGVGGAAAISPQQGRLLYEFVCRSGVRDILELGFGHGNSSCYLAAALAEGGAGHLLTIDRPEALDRTPHIYELLDETGLGPYVSPVVSSSYTWELMRVLRAQQDGSATTPRFDFVFIDGAHTWETDGFAFFLADKLLRPGGWILFDDVHWTFASSPTLRNSDRVRRMSEDERRLPQVLQVVSLLVRQHPHYGDVVVRGNWAWARKSERSGERPSLLLVDELGKESVTSVSRTGPSAGS